MRTRTNEREQECAAALQSSTVLSSTRTVLGPSQRGESSLPSSTSTTPYQRLLPTGSKWAHHSGERKIHLWPVAAEKIRSGLLLQDRPLSIYMHFSWDVNFQTGDILNATPCPRRHIPMINIPLQKACILMDIKGVNTIPFQVEKKEKKKHF